MKTRVSFLIRIKLIIFLSLFTINLFATHIVGGSMTYEYLRKDTFRINLYIYIDCQNGSPSAIRDDRIANISYFDAVTNQFFKMIS